MALRDRDDVLFGELPNAETYAEKVSFSTSCARFRDNSQGRF
jgi:hypothetical protein